MVLSGTLACMARRFISKFCLFQFTLLTAVELFEVIVHVKRSEIVCFAGVMLWFCS